MRWAGGVSGRKRPLLPGIVFVERVTVGKHLEQHAFKTAHVVLPQPARCRLLTAGGDWNDPFGHLPAGSGETDAQGTLITPRPTADN